MLTNQEIDALMERIRDRVVDGEYTEAVSELADELGVDGIFEA